MCFLFSMDWTQWTNVLWTNESYKKCKNTNSIHLKRQYKIQTFFYMSNNNFQVQIPLSTLWYIIANWTLVKKRQTIPLCSGCRMRKKRVGLVCMDWNNERYKTCSCCWHLNAGTKQWYTVPPATVDEHLCSWAFKNTRMRSAAMDWQSYFDIKQCGKNPFFSFPVAHVLTSI